MQLISIIIIIDFYYSYLGGIIFFDTWEILPVHQVLILLKPQTPLLIWHYIEINIQDKFQFSKDEPSISFFWADILLQEKNSVANIKFKNRLFTKPL